MRPRYWTPEMGEVPDYYVLRVEGTAPDGQRWAFWQALSPQLAQLMNGWMLLAVCTRWMTDKLRAKGAEPEVWTCDGEWLPWDEAADERDWADAMRWSPA